MALAELTRTQLIETREQTINIRNIIFDADSTLASLEGIDWLAKLHGVENQTKALTEQAMNGDISYDDVFPQRLKIIQPTRQEIVRLGQVYIDHITHGAVWTIHELQRRGFETFIISGGFNPSINMLGEHLNIPPQHIFANQLSGNGRYSGFHCNPLCSDHGKAQTIRYLRLWYQGRFAIVGDSFGDMTAGADLSLCYTGVITRDQAVAKSDHVIADLRQVLDYV